MNMQFTPPSSECSRCPRLKTFIDQNRDAFPDKFNAPVPSFGEIGAQVLIVGLAPGLKGANFTGRPFTADYAGDLLYPTLIKYSFASGEYDRHAQDRLSLHNCRITNAVRCVPPQNKPTGEEINTCNDFLRDEIQAMKNLRVIVSLGGVSHRAVLKAFKLKLSSLKFAHNVTHSLSEHIHLVDSYHCSRYNTNTGRLTSPMFENVFETVKKILKV